MKKILKEIINSDLFPALIIVVIITLIVGCSITYIDYENERHTEKIYNINNIKT